MRFDDRLSTMLACEPTTPSAAMARWAQIADLLAQDGKAMPPTLAARGLAALALLRNHVPVDVRAMSVRGLARRCRFAPLAVLLAAEPVQVAAPLFDGLQLDDEEWLAILPDIGPLPRSRLRLRGDLPEAVRRALADFGATDFALPGAAYDVAAPSLSAAGAAPVPAGALASPPVDPAGSDISRLVERIETWRQRKPGDIAAMLPTVNATDADDVFIIQFAADSEGFLRAIAGVPRGAFVGICLARTARPGDVGVDAGVARAFEKRAAICQGRLVLAPGNPWSGLWLIDADPMFDQPTGRFTGYSGTLSHRDEAVVARESLSDADQYDAVRQMLHELRSPLNAISGFAQLIDGQYFGPVSPAYRSLNRAILDDASRLTSGIEDLALAAELDNGGYRVISGKAVIADALAVIAERHPSVAIGEIQPHAVVRMDSQDLIGLIDRIIRAIDPEHGAVAAIDVTGSTSGHVWTIAVTRTAPLVSIGSAAARDAAQSLATRLADLHGGSLIFEAHSASLNLPGVAVKAEAAY